MVSPMTTARSDYGCVCGRNSDSVCASVCAQQSKSTRQLYGWDTRWGTSAATVKGTQG
eukprot:m.24323 g.24323  ORF g.24323 m.24323 type:complete len:58 (-) comp4152_c0_seq1:235-408(-)